MTSIHRIFFSIALAAFLSAPASAQEQAAAETTTETAATTTTTASQTAAPPATAAVPAPGSEEEGYSAEHVRRDFETVLRRLPNQVPDVLKLDPSLFRNEAWMATYPTLRDFVARHPEVAQNPGYFLANVWLDVPLSPEERRARAASEMAETFIISMVMLVVTIGLIWLIRTILEHRRWSRMTRTQTEMQNKLLDRFTTHEELLRYVQSGAGKDLLQAAMPSAQPNFFPPANPLSRILWPAQIGVVLFAIGLGMQLVGLISGGNEGRGILFFGVILLAAGAGAVASAFVAWQISRKLGPGGEFETNANPSRTLTER
jgi:hypothetical protein